MNPAMSGAYSGTVRIGGIYRDQGRSVLSSDAFTTPAFFADAPVLMVGKRHWVGVGLMAYQDNVGTLGQKTSTIQLSGAFHYSLNRKSTSVLTLGFQGGQLSRDYDLAEISTEGNIDNGQGPGILNSNENGLDEEANASGLDLNAGVMLKAQLNKTTNLTAGLSARHLNSPDLSVAGGNKDDRDFKFRFIGHAELEMELNDKFSIAPTVYFTNMASASQFQLQGWGGYMLNKEKNIKLRFGLGYRLGDAGEILVGLDYGALRVALGYDVTLSGLSDANNGSGGFEIAANYIISVYKKPKVTPAVLCPQL
jgi:type IX secretion system PorP/SprF family membrane protein